jgi:hypothetical protein
MKERERKKEQRVITVMWSLPSMPNALFLFSPSSLNHHAWEIKPCVPGI